MTALVFTHSDIKAFLACRRSWYWSYVQDFRAPEKPVGPLALGSRVHAAIESYYRDPKHADPIAIHEELFRRDLTKLEDESAPPWMIDQLCEDVIIGRNCVKLHRDWLADTGADDNYEVQAVEQVIEAPFLDGRVILRGKVDVLFRRKDNGFLVVDDLKTDGGWSGGTREQLERSWQHHIYLIALRLAAPDAIVGGAQYTVIKKVKNPARATTPLVHRHTVPATARVHDAKVKQLEVICREMLDTMERIEAEGVAHAYPVPSTQCQWCEFKQPCEIMDESTAAARSMLDANYTRGGRHGRYEESEPT